MKLVERDAVVIRARRPFLEWLQSIAEIDTDDLTLKEINQEATILLIPEMENMDEVHTYLRPGKVMLMEQELEDWCPDKEVWPRQRSPKLFDEWFRLEYHSLILDTVEGEDDEGELV